MLHEEDAYHRAASGAQPNQKRLYAGSQGADAGDTRADSRRSRSPQKRKRRSRHSLTLRPIAPDADARLQEISTKKDELLTQFDDGDITAREYQKQLDDSRQERKIEFEQHEAKLAQKMSSSACKTTDGDVQRFHRAQRDLQGQSTAIQGAGREEVRELTGKPETANWTGQRFLDEAHKNLKAFCFMTPQRQRLQPQANCRPILPRCQPPKVRTPTKRALCRAGSVYHQRSDGLRGKTLSKMSVSERIAYLAS